MLILKNNEWSYPKVVTVGYLVTVASYSCKKFAAFATDLSVIILKASVEHFSALHSYGEFLVLPRNI
jgi:hypothetical protein